MNIASEIWYLLKKEFTLEFRQKYAISGILLYIFSTIFVVYTSAIQATGKEWIVLFWIIILFASVNAVTKSFVQESGSRQLYYYSLANPIAIILSKMIYNMFLLVLLTLLAFGFFALLVGNPIRDLNLFFIVLLLASIGFSITFTFISAISSKADNSASLMAILSFPIIIPILLTLEKLSSAALNISNDGSIAEDIWILLGIDLLLAGASILLFPFLWRN